MTKSDEAWSRNAAEILQRNAERDLERAEENGVNPDISDARMKQRTAQFIAAVRELRTEQKISFDGSKGYPDENADTVRSSLIVSRSFVRETKQFIETMAHGVVQALDPVAFEIFNEYAEEYWQLKDYRPGKLAAAHGFGGKSDCEADTVTLSLIMASELAAYLQAVADNGAVNTATDNDEDIEWIRISRDEAQPVLTQRTLETIRRLYGEQDSQRLEKIAVSLLDALDQKGTDPME